MGWLFGGDKTSMVSPADALTGRSTEMPVPARHAILDAPLAPTYPVGTEIADFGLGCFWGAERVFWQVHDPTQSMRQGNDAGTQYRSAIYWRSPEQQKAAEASREAYQEVLKRPGYGEIATDASASASPRSAISGKRPCSWTDSMVGERYRILWPRVWSIARRSARRAE
ncbi:peptide-methionine (S)-S-oxide reductase [Nonomuraea sp. NPDC049129]|uniref:peptide-methionine (S)-S-oxide reductase n=1 Tax=Nonomuraea sp. NPDC049129 TaxID=3155272 RepID=UPI0033F477A3